MVLTPIEDIKEPVTVTLGSFDGIHLGHLDLMKHLNSMSREHNSKSLLLTFQPHPREVVNPDYDIRYITTFDEKVAILKSSGIDYMAVQPFNRDIMKTSPKEFIKSYILDKVKVNHFVIGFNHHFGKDREGGIATLHELGREYGFSVSSVDPTIIGEKPISSTIVRNSVLEWDGKAKNYLGRYFFMDGVVVDGKKRGRTIGFPTLNLEPDNPKKLRPEVGVYFTAVDIDGKKFFSITNVGYKPTFNEKGKTVESHVFNFDRDCYGKSVRIFFLERMRDEMKFDGIESLKAQLELDRETGVKLMDRYSFEDPCFI